MVNKLVSKALGSRSAPTKSPVSRKPPPPATPSHLLDADRKYQVEDGLKTLARAEEIRNDKKLMKDMAKHHASLGKVLVGKMKD